MESSPEYLLVFDGDCAFCRYCADYARALSGGQVSYRPYQSLDADDSALDQDDYAAAIQLFQDGVHVASGADAAFTLLAIAGRPFWSWAYRHLPGASTFSEGLYGWVARHRGACHALARFAIGEHWQPAEYSRTAALFLRCLAAIFLIAFISFAVQAPGLIGSDGILPAAEFLQAAHEQLGTAAYRQAPSLLWLNASDTAIALVSVAGISLSFVLASLRHTRLAAVGLFILYMSLVHVGQRFMNYQWDMLLLECGFLAVVLGQWRHLGVFLYRWLLFRLLFLSGVVKLVSGDMNWWQLTALQYHFETQPLPTAFAWYLHQLPDDVLKFMAAATLFVELLLPFFLFAPRQLRLLAGIGIAVFQLLIIASGNFNFFNLLVLALCVWVLDDQMLPSFLQARVPPNNGRVRYRRFDKATCYLMATTILFLSTSQLLAVISQRQPPLFVATILRAAQPLHLTHHYGVFAIMSTERYEIIIEGSYDGENWHAYPYRHKPFSTGRVGHWATPHQPRLDWQMWFAALDNYDNQYWIERLLLRLGTGSEAVTRLFAESPFAPLPPLYLRALIYRYHFSDWQTRAQTGEVWQRELMGHYSPVIRFIARQEQAPAI